MKPAPFDYYAPEGLEEALRLRSELGPEASVLAGGQSLVPMLNMRLGGTERADRSRQARRASLRACFERGCRRWSDDDAPHTRALR